MADYTEEQRGPDLPAGWGSVDRFGRMLGDRWMSVEDGLPAQRGRYLVVKGDPFRKGEVHVSWFCERYSGEPYRFPSSVTYWQYLPSMPKKRNKRS